MSENTILITIIAIGLAILTSYHFHNRDFYRHLFEWEAAFDAGLDFAHLTKSILKKVMEETSASAGIIYWFDEVQNEYKLKSLAGIPAEQINQVAGVLRQPGGVLDRVRDGSGVYQIALRLVRNCPEAELAPSYRTLLVIPLIIEKRPLGSLFLFKTQGRFTPRQQNLLTLFASRSAIRLENARLYRLAKETALENTKLYINLSKLYQQTTMDELTGLNNRNFLMQRIKEELKKAWRLRQPLSLIFIDLDFFKNVNDQYGHPVGDQLLSEFGRFLRETIREYDIACRFGGEEFIVLLPQTISVNALELAERLREKLSQREFCKESICLRITASFGVSFMPLTELSAESDEESLVNISENMIAWADDALYQAKKAGRNRVVLHRFGKE